MKAGAARIEITPPPGLPMAGFGSRTQAAQGTHDPLYARALVMEGPAGSAVLVSADLCWVPDAEAIAELVSARTGIPRERLQLAATHTHGGPAFQGAAEGTAELAQRIAAAVEQAWRGRRKAVAAVGAAPVHGIGKNRRRPDGPVDHDVTVLRVDDTAGHPIATLLNYSCHPTTLGPNNLLYTADYPGVACAAVEQAVGGVALFTTGAQGDVNPGGYSAEGSMIGEVVPWRTYASARQYGEAVAQVAVAVRGRLHPESHQRVWGRSRQLQLPRNPLPAPEEAEAAVAAARQRLEQVRAHGAPEELRAAQITLAYAQVLANQAADPKGNQPVAIRLSALALGPALHIGIQGELFAELGLQIKAALGQGSTFVAVVCDGWAGYIPTRGALAEGGYEAAAAIIAPGGGETVAEAAIALARGST